MSLPRRSSIRQWLRPGIHIKRWILLLIAGILTVIVSIEFLLIDVLRGQTTGWLVELGTARPVFAVLGALAGVGLTVAALFRLNQSLLSPFMDGKAKSLLYELEAHHARKDGPKIVAIGGGTGLSTLLRGLKEYTSNIAAIVTVADDGGSSGRLRQEFGVLPPGDFRQCIAALAEDEALTTALFQYRFSEGESLKGHAFGNLFIVAMAGVTGNFETALLESGRVLAIRGRILPSTLTPVTLCADLRDGTALQREVGESAIGHSQLPIERVHLEPDAPPAYPEAVRAILEADLILAGPGSLYTSVLPNLLVPGIAQALRHSRAPKMYIANVATQLGETLGYSLHDHMQAIEQHIGRNVFTHMLVNNNLAPSLPGGYSIKLLAPDDTTHGYKAVSADVIDNLKPWRHDSRKLAKAIEQFISAAHAQQPSAVSRLQAPVRSQSQEI